ncbi:MAG TPA: phosphate uptake regulator PhoU [Archaeoglobus profundus]|nr:phosphate uptake regulator PhoU [Archaeoglobus profundus]
MEIRKLQLIGGSSYMISLPKSWIKANKLNQGDELILQVDRYAIKIYPRKISDDIIRVEVDKIPRQDDKFLRRFIYALYIQGLDEITIVKNNLSQEAIAKIGEIVRDLIGMEIIDVTDSKIVMRCLTTDFDVLDVLKRMGQIICEMINLIEDHLKDKSVGVIDIISKLEEDTDRFYLLTIRLEHRKLRKIPCPVNLDEMKQLLGVRIVAKLLEEIADSLYDIPGVLNSNLSSKKDEDRVLLPLLLEFKKIFRYVLDAYFNSNIFNCEDAIEMVEDFEDKIVEARTKVETCKLAIDSLLEACRYTKSIGEIAFNKAVREVFIEY